jgi:hypothetical protein
LAHFVLVRFAYWVGGMRQFSPKIEPASVQSLKPYPRNARRHSRAQIKQIAASIERFGFSNPVLIPDDGEIIAGHGRVAAAKLLGIDMVPAVRLSHLTEAERRAYVIADKSRAQRGMGPRIARDRIAGSCRPRFRGRIDRLLAGRG